jgi:hypothetical protein
MGLFTEASVAIDGSKFKAVNNRDRNFTRAKMERRRQERLAGLNRAKTRIAPEDAGERETGEPWRPGAYTSRPSTSKRGSQGFRLFRHIRMTAESGAASFQLAPTMSISPSLPMSATRMLCEPVVATTCCVQVAPPLSLW